MKTVFIALVWLVTVLLQWDSPTVTMLSVFLALAIGEKVNKFMSTKIKYTNEPLGEVKVVADMLPSPEELAFKEESVKVTISLSKSSVDFFKREAKKHDTKYQQMIRRLLDAYTRAQDRHITNH